MEDMLVGYGAVVMKTGQSVKQTRADNSGGRADVERELQQSYWNY